MKLLLLCTITLLTFSTVQTSVEDDRFRSYLQDGEDSYNKRAERRSNQYSILSWAYYTNITTYNQQQMTAYSLVYSESSKNDSLYVLVNFNRSLLTDDSLIRQYDKLIDIGISECKDATKNTAYSLVYSESSKNDSLYVLANFNRSLLTDASLIRQYDKLIDIGISGYEDPAVLKRIAEIEAEMTGIYSSAKWCKTADDCKALEPGLTDVLTNSRNYEELTEAWKGWRDVSGAKMKGLYEEFVTLMNRAIQAGGQYPDMGAYYRSWYEQPTFEADVRDLFNTLAPLYDQLHAYVRNKLKAHYGADKFPADGHIPAHILGNMWAQQWGNIYDLLEPYPGKGRPSLTNIMQNKNYNITYMYRVAEEFFMSIGMKPMPDTFWTLSMLEKPPDRDVVCHASAWDFNNGTDFRIKQCTEVTEDQMITVHHEMGHVEYDLSYKHQPYLFRDGANPGFHEGVADIVSLSFQTPEHLLEIGLIDSLPNGTEGDINFLFQMALDKVAFLPFGYLIDQWRWSVYRGETTPANYNAAWWDLRCKYQGISPPVERSENDFDPGAKYHIPGNTPYIRYFVSYVAQFQWHKALCELIWKGEPLHRCDIYRNRTAGTRQQEMLRMGSSQPWGEAMRTITRGTSGETDKLDAQALLDYFKPLQEWLEKENARIGETVGWNKSKCPVFRTTSSASGPSIGVRVMASLLIVTLSCFKMF